MARGEFSIVIAGLAVGVEPRIGPLATAYVLILVIIGPLTARWTEPIARRIARRPPPAALDVPAAAEPAEALHTHH